MNMFNLGNVLKTGKQLLDQQGGAKLNSLKQQAIGGFHQYKDAFEKATGPKQQAELADQAWKTVAGSLEKLAGQGAGGALGKAKSLVDRKKNALGSMVQGFVKDPGKLQDSLHDLPLLLQGAEEKATREVAQLIGGHLTGKNKLEPGAVMSQAETFLNKSVLPLARKMGGSGFPF
jgi:hypothetical protein